MKPLYSVFPAMCYSAVCLQTKDAACSHPLDEVLFLMITGILLRLGSFNVQWFPDGQGHSQGFPSHAYEA